MSARARANHTEDEKREMRDTLRIERDALRVLDEQEGWFIYRDCPYYKAELVRAMSGMSECALRRTYGTLSENCKGKLLVTKE
jgi:hypothetical protein